MCHHSSARPPVRYVADVVSLHRRLGFRALTSQIPSADLLRLAVPVAMG